MRDRASLERLVREAFQAHEFDDTDERSRERAYDLGGSILLPMVETVERVTVGETVGERHTIRGEFEPIEALLDHLREQSLTLVVDRDSAEDDDRVVEFVKVAEATHDQTQYYLDEGSRDE